MTRHDEHYAQMAIQPIEMMEQILQRENIPPIPRAHIATAGHYLNRAGTKEEWTKDLEKASNYLYRALHGVWPWDERKVLTEPSEQIRAIYNVLGPKVPECSGCKAEWEEALRICLEAGCEKTYDITEKKVEQIIPPRDSGEALVWMECWVWFDTYLDGDPRKAVVTKYCENSMYECYGVINGEKCRFYRKHAQPVELGHPDPSHPEYRGEP